MSAISKMEEVVAEVSSVSKQIANGTFGSEQRPWLNFEGIAEVGQFDYEGLHDEIFDRKEANDEYAKAQSAGTPRKVAQVAKLAADFLAGFERDVRMRRRTRVRMFIHGGNRAAANGQDNGPLRCHTVNWLTRILAETKDS